MFIYLNEKRPDYSGRFFNFDIPVYIYYVKRLFLFVVFSTIFFISSAQVGPTCGEIQPIYAAGNTLFFEGAWSGNSNQPLAEDGPDYGCLSHRFNPSWFYMRIDEEGDFDFILSQNSQSDGLGNPLDIDFILWGPFDENQAVCDYDNSLINDNIVDCSVANYTSESIRIENAKAGEFYVLMTLNFTTEEGYISLTQTNRNSPNAGLTDSTIVDPLLESDKGLCPNSQLVLDAYNSLAVSYSWSFTTDSGTTTTLSNTTSQQVAQQGGIYHVKVLTSNGITIEDEITITELVRANTADDIVQCEESFNEATFNLTEQNAAIKGDFKNSFYEVAYFTSLADAQLFNDKIEVPSAYISGNAKIYARLDYTSAATSCYDISSFNLKVNQMPEIDEDFFDNESNLVCVDDRTGLAFAPFDLGEDLGNDYVYDWTPNNDRNNDGIEEPIFRVRAAGDYQLVITDKATGCESIIYKTSFEPAGPPKNVFVKVETNSFSANSLYQISISTEGGLSAFEYALDDVLGPYQSSNIFTNVRPGAHVIYVRDGNACGVTVSKPFRIIDYPKFFTPNGDGLHDTWNIFSLNTTLNADAELYIFDRKGKLLKKVNPQGAGWNGVYNGFAMPSDSYWFLLKYIEPRDLTPQEFKASFVLKR
ncbi:MAG: T9SS type B sorting domain-containing protein [Leeuwenhoekiella sp.]